MRAVVPATAVQGGPPREMWLRPRSIPDLRSLPNCERHRCLTDLAMRGDLEAVRFLCERSSVVGVVVDKDLLEDLHRYAAAFGHVAMVDYLQRVVLRRYAPFFKHFVNAALSMAADSGNLPLVRFLCERTVENASIELDFDMPLHRAMENNSVGVVRYLCHLPAARGVDVADTCLWCVRHGEFELMRFLCELPSARGVAVHAALEREAGHMPLSELHYLYTVFVTRNGTTDDGVVHTLQRAREAAMRAQNIEALRYLHERRQGELEWGVCELDQDEEGTQERYMFHTISTTTLTVCGLLDNVPVMTCQLEQLERMERLGWGQSTPLLISQLFHLHRLKHHGNLLYSPWQARALSFIVLVWHGGDVWMDCESIDRICGMLKHHIAYFTAMHNASWNVFMAPVYTRVLARARRQRVWRRRRALLLLRMLRDAHRARVVWRDVRKAV